MLNNDEKGWLRLWAPRVGGSAYLLLTFAFMTGHPRPGSLDSLLFALTSAFVPALGATVLIMAGALLYRRRGRS